jgi:hypothetical protein
MKVGDLVKVLTNHYLSFPFAQAHGKLAVITGFDKYACDHWRVKTMDGMVLWLKSNELELLNESR